MFPARFWLALGSGQRLNEDITGLPWPDKPERHARLAECAGVISSLLRGETVTHRGRVTAIDAKLYSHPGSPPRVFGAAVTESTAEFVGSWADGLLTIHGDPERPVRSSRPSDPVGAVENRRRCRCR
jgi:coenzyme F420-dependent glucose-6-phosphate dehydrogenase